MGFNDYGYSSENVTCDFYCNINLRVIIMLTFFDTSALSLPQHWMLLFTCVRFLSKIAQQKQKLHKWNMFFSPMHWYVLYMVGYRSYILNGVTASVHIDGRMNHPVQIFRKQCLRDETHHWWSIIMKLAKNNEIIRQTQHLRALQVSITDETRGARCPVINVPSMRPCSMDAYYMAVAVIFMRHHRGLDELRDGTYIKQWDASYIVI